MAGIVPSFQKNKYKKIKQSVKLTFNLASSWTIMFGGDNVSNVKMNIPKLVMKTDLWHQGFISNDS